MKTSTKFAAATLTIASLAVAGLALAHPGTGMGMGPGMGMQQAGTPEQMAAAVATRLGDLKATLKITPAQEAAWSAYAAVVTRHAEARNAMHTAMQAQMQATSGAAQDPSALHNTMLALQQQQQTERSDALKSLYAALTPEQQAVADRTLPGPMGGGMGSGMGAGMGMGGAMGGRMGGGMGSHMGGAMSGQMPGHMAGHMAGHVAGGPGAAGAPCTNGR